MSELKSFIVLYNGKFIRAYEESKADKLIAELEESHKKEVGQLLIEIAELKNEIEKQKRLRDMALASVPNVLKVMKIIQHHKYKRCLAMAMWCDEAYRRECGLNPEEMTDKEFYKQQIEFWPRWSSRWLAIGEIQNKLNSPVGQRKK